MSRAKKRKTAVSFSERELWARPDLWPERSLRRRELQRACAWDYTHVGHDAHEAKPRCDHEYFGGERCAREYNPWAEDGVPADPRMYHGTGIAALYRLPDGERFLQELAGWNITQGWEEPGGELRVRAVDDGAEDRDAEPADPRYRGAPLPRDDGQVGRGSERGRGESREVGGCSPYAGEPAGEREGAAEGAGSFGGVNAEAGGLRLSGLTLSLSSE